MNPAVFFAVLFSVVLGIGGVASAGFKPSEVVYPPQKLNIKFSHKLHIGAVVPASGKKIKADCVDCHEKATTSVVSSDSLTPPEEACADCHPIDRDDPDKETAPGKAPGRCDACHVGPDPKNPARLEIPEPNLKFNHKIHVDRKIGCETCHGGMEKVDLATRDGLPRMPSCLKCHNQIATENRAPAKCATCHRQNQEGLIQTDYPSGRLVPSGTLKGDRHTPEFETNHAAVARNDEAYCLNCHQRSYCLSCHNGVVKPLSFHGNDYINIHPIDARKMSNKCQGCHRLQSFCLACHERSGVVDKDTVRNAPNSLMNAVPPKRFHPPTEKWTNPPRTPEHHAWQAERNIKQCVSCHREETCLECHSTSGVNVNGLPSQRPFNVNPHPPGWAGSRECRALSARNGRVCLKCHNPADPNLTNCGR